jgi:hypothetical protein
MRRSALAAGGALTLLSSLLVLAACPSLSEIDVGSPDATAERTVPKLDTGVDARGDVTARDAGVDAPCLADVTADPNNCGRCGHDCLDGACSNGVCQAVVLYSGEDTPTSIVVEGPSLFVTVDTGSTSGGYLFRCSTSDCMGTKTVLATGLVNPWFAVGFGGNVFWDNSGAEDGGAITDPGSVVSCPEEGCPDSGPAVYSMTGTGTDGGANISGLAVDSTFIYWADLFGYSGLTGAIYQCPLENCGASITQLVGGDNYIPLAIAIDPSHYVYWTDLGTNQVLRCKLPSCGGSPDIFANNQTGASGLALYDHNVYWTQGIDDGGILRCSTGGCATPTTLAKGQANPYAVVVDESGAYWTNIDDGTVMRCPLTDCTKPEQLAQTEAAFAIALDAVSVYFTNSSSLGEVLRVAK